MDPMKKATSKLKISDKKAPKNGPRIAPKPKAPVVIAETEDFKFCFCESLRGPPCARLASLASVCIIAALELLFTKLPPTPPRQIPTQIIQI